MSRPRGRSRAGGEGPSPGGLMQPGNSEENLYKAVLRASEGKKGTGWGPRLRVLLPLEARLSCRLCPARRSPSPAPPSLPALPPGHFLVHGMGSKGPSGGGSGPGAAERSRGGSFSPTRVDPAGGGGAAAVADPRQVLPEEGKPLRPKVPSGIAEPGRRRALGRQAAASAKPRPHLPRRGLAGRRLEGKGSSAAGEAGGRLCWV